MVIENAEQSQFKINLIKSINSNTIKEDRNKKEILNKNFESVCHPPTKIPIAIKNSLEEELDRLTIRKANVSG